jgi:hypothetical protein
MATIYRFFFEALQSPLVDAIDGDRECIGIYASYPHES